MTTVKGAGQIAAKATAATTAGGNSDTRMRGTKRTTKKRTAKQARDNGDDNGEDGSYSEGDKKLRKQKRPPTPFRPHARRPCSDSSTRLHRGDRSPPRI